MTAGKSGRIIKLLFPVMNWGVKVLRLQRTVVGRFAPSPTGPLHFGTLVAALGSYLIARQAGGRWLLRIEDLDPPRVVPGAADAMLRLLEGLGFEWDGEVVYQSRRSARYRQVLEDLRCEGRVFDCGCSRREILASAPHPGEEGPVYPGTCREGLGEYRSARAVRLRVADERVRFRDGIFGEQAQDLERQVGDFVLYRADGVYAYQLAVVVDDIDAGVTQVVRGADLLSSTPRQIFLYRCLGEEPPEYYHLPLVLGTDAEKLSKRHGHGSLVSKENGGDLLWKALVFLGQSPPEILSRADCAELLAWGCNNFRVAEVRAENRQMLFSDERPFCKPESSGSFLRTAKR